MQSSSERYPAPFFFLLYKFFCRTKNSIHIFMSSIIRLSLCHIFELSLIFIVFYVKNCLKKNRQRDRNVMTKIKKLDDT